VSSARLRLAILRLVLLTDGVRREFVEVGLGFGLTRCLLIVIGRRSDEEGTVHVREARVCVRTFGTVLVRFFSPMASDRSLPVY